MAEMEKRIADTILERSRNVGIKMTDIDAQNLARYVLGTIREPTAEMVRAVPHTIKTDDGLGFVGGDPLGTWQRMVDAA